MSEETNKNIQLFSFGKEYQKVECVEVGYRRGSIVLWGRNNKLPEYYLELKNKSVMHSRILESKKQMIGGMGWNTQNATQEIVDLLNNDISKYDLNDVLLQSSEQISDISGLFLMVYWSLDRSRVARVEIVPFQNIRVIYPNVDSPTPAKVEWFEINESGCWDPKFPSIKYYKYSKEHKLEYPVQIQYWNPSAGFYPSPDYASADDVINLESKLDRFYLSSVINGFSMGKQFSFIGKEPEPTAKAEMIRQMRNTLEGEGNANKSLLEWVVNKDNATVVTDLSSDKDNSKFVYLQNERINQAVMTAHGVTNPSLFAVKTPGSLGSSKELIDSLNIFQSLVIDPVQKVIEDIFNEFLKDSNINYKLTINKFKIYTSLELDLSKIIEIVTGTLPYELKINLLEMGGLDPNRILKMLPAEQKTNQPQNGNV